jgi:hypothetical protein
MMASQSFLSVGLFSVNFEGCLSMLDVAPQNDVGLACGDVVMWLKGVLVRCGSTKKGVGKRGLGDKIGVEFFFWLWPTPSPRKVFNSPTSLFPLSSTSSPPPIFLHPPRSSPSPPSAASITALSSPPTAAAAAALRRVAIARYYYADIARSTWGEEVLQEGERAFTSP